MSVLAEIVSFYMIHCLIIPQNIVSEIQIMGLHMGFQY